jgi:hypothetical protein
MNALHAVKRAHAFAVAARDTNPSLPGLWLNVLATLIHSGGNWREPFEQARSRPVS